MLSHLTSKIKLVSTIFLYKFPTVSFITGILYNICTIHTHSRNIYVHTYMRYVHLLNLPNQIPTVSSIFPVYNCNWVCAQGTPS